VSTAGTGMRAFDPLATDLRGTNLIEASAGTGKTYAIATLFLRLMLEEGLGVDQILVVTFTEAAAAELRDRVRSRLRAALHAYRDIRGADPVLARLVSLRKQGGHAALDRERLSLSLRSFDEAPISTIHGFCNRVLHDSAFESGVAFDTELVIDDEPIVDQVLRDFWARELYGSDARFVRHLHREGLSPDRLLPLARLALRHVDAPVVPDRVELGRQPAGTVYAEAYRRVREIWWRDREDIKALLLGFPHLHKARYRKDDMPTWFLAMDAFLRAEEPGPELGSVGFDKFLPDSLAEATSVKHTRSGGRPPEHAFFDACAALDAARRPLEEDHRTREVELKRRLVAHVRREVPRRKVATGVQSFDDLLQRLDKALRGRAGRRLAEQVRKRYRAALIDEFQDTDPIQYRIFRTLYGGTKQPLFLIGDPKQAIYGFRGADVFTYLRAAKAAGESRYTMDTNWRSDPALLSAVERLFAVRRPFLVEDIGFPPVRPRPGAIDALWGPDGRQLPAFEIKVQPRDGAMVKTRQITAEWAERHVPERIAADVSRLLAQGATLRGPEGERPLHAGDVAVLVRKNDQALAVQRELRRLGIPGVVYGDATVFDTPEADELYRVLGAVAEPTRSSLLRAAITTELFGVSANALEAMSEDEDTEWNRWIDDFRRWHEQWVERGFVQMFRALLSERSTQPRLLTMQDGERRMTNLLHLAELLHGAAGAEHLGPSGLLRWFQQQRRTRSSMVEAVKLRLERDDQAVQLITIHRSKGLEYPVVYCPYLWDGGGLFSDEEDNLLYHDPEDDHRLKIDVRIKGGRKERDADPFIALARFEKAAENLRLLYVAVTRARHRCVVVWGGFYRSHRSPLGYLIGSPLHDERWPWDPELVAAKLKDLEDEPMLRWLRERGAGAWALSRLDVGEAIPYRAPPVADVEIAARRPAVAIDRSRRTASFTTMVADRELPQTAGEGRDRDERTPDAPRTGPLPASEGPIPLAEFPRGAKAGNFFHDVLENLDFMAPATDRDALVDAKLAAYGYPREDWSEPVRRALHGVLETPLLAGDPTLRLSAIGPSRRRNELEFILPTAGGEHGDAIALTRERLAAMFRRHGEGLPPGYPEQVDRLGFSPLRGFLKGFIDLVLVHRDRWYLADYKTNHLGEDLGAYAPPHLGETMVEDHYVLQYHLYTVALVRHLGRTVPGFRYDRDFGGVFYLFLRGMTPAAGATRGVFFDRPPAARIEALSDLLRGGPME